MRLPFFVDLPNSQRGRRSGWVSMTPQGTANLFRWTGRSLAFLGIKTKSFKKIKFIVCHDTRGWVVSVHAKTYSTACVRVRTTLQNLDRLTLSRRPCAINQIPMSDWLPFHFPSVLSSCLYGLHLTIQHSFPVCMAVDLIGR